ncbi:MAG: GlcG/HbpS family heme-binding protein [Stellaceae bacterium]
MKTTIRSFALAALPAVLLLCPAVAVAAAPSYGPAIDLAAAKKVAAAAEAAAQKVSSQPDVIAIVDPHGALVYFERMDGAQFGSIEVALSKARSAALFRRPTKVFAERMAKGATALLGLVGATPVPGGEPILANGKVIGAIGASGGTGEEDDKVAMAGVAVVK